MSAIKVLDLDMSVVPMFCAMQNNGIAISKDEFALLDTEYTGKCEELSSKINTLAGRTLNPGSSEQVEAFLFKELKLQKYSLIAKRTEASGKDGNPERWSTSGDILMSIIDKHPVIEPIIRWKEYDKLLNTYIRVLPQLVSSDGRVRSENLRITRTTTGRPSMSRPNLLAQPTRSKDAKRVRRGFVAPPGRELIELDFSQLQMRGAAHCSQDPVMCSILNTGGDIHSETASSIFRLPIPQLDEMSHRYPAKRAGFGVLFCISGLGLLRVLIDSGCVGWDEEKCTKLINDWYGIYEGIKQYQEEIKTMARRWGKVEDMFGRVRLVPEVFSVHKEIREAGLRQAVNGPIQMLEVGIIKSAMREIWKMIVNDLGVERVKPLLQIYDSLLFEVEKGMGEWVAALFREIMENVVELIVPVKASPAIGENWGEMVKLA